MNGEVPSVPITTLAGIASLTDLLPQLPLPTPLPNAVNNKSLLYHAKLAEEARRLLANADDALANQLIYALRQSSTDHIELKDNLPGDTIEGEIPDLLKSILSKEPGVFRGNRGQDARAHRHGNHSTGSHYQTPFPSVPQSNSQRYNQQHHVPGSSTPYVQNDLLAQSTSNPFQQQFQNFMRGGIGAVNGEHVNMTEAEINQNRLSRSRSTRQQGQGVNSTAQASMAESVVSHKSADHPANRVQRRSDPLADTLINQSSEDASQPHGRSRRQASTRAMEAISKEAGKEDLNVNQNSSDSVLSRSDFSRSDSVNSSKSFTAPKGPLPVVVLKPLDPKMLKSIETMGAVRTESSKKGHKRRSDDVIYLDDSDDDFRSKRRRHSGHNNEEMDSGEEERYEAQRRKKKERRQKRFNQQHTLTTEELLDSPTFKKFSNSMEYIFDSAEDVNFGSLDPNDEEVECPPESLIAKNVLSELCGEVAKLKSMGVLNQVPAEKLVKLLTILQWNIKDGSKLLPNMNQDIEDEEEQKMWREITMERVTRSMDASLTAMYIMTAKDMPKQVYLEDVIERVIIFGKFQLQNTIYPEFDPVYRVDPKDKDGYSGSYRMKRARAGQVKHKSTVTLYNKLCDMVGNLAELIEIQELTDTVILQVSTLGVSTFFVENVSELQLSAMKLVTTIFAHYDKHRQLILEDIFASLARLPSSKRNLRNYRLNADESIQMVTALALQLIQCIPKMPSVEPGENKEEKPDSPSPERDKSSKKAKSRDKVVSTQTGATDQDVVIVTSYETAMRNGHNFLSVFLKKCTIKGDEDYRPLFENFVQDLLSTVNKPEWPASELLLSLLGRILVQQFSNKSVDMSLRVASLEYLGIVAARLRKDAVSSQLNQEMIDDIVEKVNEVNDSEEDVPRKHTRGRKSPLPKNEDRDQTQELQRAMLDYLAYNGQNEPAYLFARQFYIAQWYRDVTVEAQKQNKIDEEREFDEKEDEKTTEVLQNAEKRKSFLLTQVATNYKPFSSYKPSPSKLDYESSCLVARYLSSKRPFAQSFDIYLRQILRVLSESAVAVRTKAMKCLTAVVESDPGILARRDMEIGVHGRFLDQSTSVREAAIELVGKFILIRPELIPQYYDMLSERILDTGISVRKRVIKIFRDIFVEHSCFEKIPEMCVKMIRRVNDEEGIKKLVNEVFQTMWFTPLSARDKDSAKLIQRVVNITEVVSASKDTGYEFIEQLLENLLKKDEHGNFNKSALTACRQIVDCLVENVLRLEEKSGEEGKAGHQRLTACLSTLYLFSKIKPDLMVQHATTLQPYLDIKCSSSGEFWILHYVAKILELVVPLMDHPSESFLAQLEEDMMKLILKHGMMVLQSCVSCLGSVVNNVSHNYALVKDCFQKFFGVLAKMMADHKENPDSPLLKTRKPTLLRSLYTVGLLCKHFDFDSKEMGEAKMCVRDRVFDVMLYFLNHEDEEVRYKALSGLGFMAVRHYDFMLRKVMKDIYSEYLTHPEVPMKLKIQTLKNLQSYLVEEENRMAKADAEWKKHAKAEDLKEMGDVQSGMASTIMQVYLKEVLEAFFSSQTQMRLQALNVIQLVLRQGLIHPVQCVPYLIGMGSDTEAAIRVKADQQLQEIEKKYPGFIHMKALQGIKMSYKLQELLANEEGSIIRGLRAIEDNLVSVNAYLYTVLRTNRSHRRAILTSLLNLFDDTASPNLQANLATTHGENIDTSKINLAEQVFIADNLAFFPYQTQDEPLFIIHQIDIIVSVSGSNLLQSFREMLTKRSSQKMALPAHNENGERNVARRILDDDEDEDAESLLNLLPKDISPLQEICRLSQGCILLLYLKQQLKDLYGFTDSKIQNYSPTEAAKVYDKPLTRKNLVKFNPECVLDVLREGEPEDPNSEEARRKLVKDYLEFKDLMLSIDPPDEDETDETKSTGHHTPTPGRAKPEVGASGDNTIPIEDGENDDVVVLEMSSGGDVDTVNNTEDATMKTPSRSHHHHHHSLSSHKKRTQGSRPLKLPGASTPHNPQPKTKTPSTKKKKPKRRKHYGSDSEDDSDDDPDFVL